MIFMSAAPFSSSQTSRAYSVLSSLACAVLLILQGCLAPVDGPIVSANPPANNQPPAILPSQINPAAGVVSLNANCAKHIFHLGVIEEQDLQDRLFIRWFIDYNESSSPFVMQENLLGSEQTDSAREAPNFVLEPDSPLQFPRGYQTAPNGYHILEALVSDRNYEPGEPPNRKVPDEARVDRAWWLLRFSDDTPCADNGGQP